MPKHAIPSYWMCSVIGKNVVIYGYGGQPHMHMGGGKEKTSKSLWWDGLLLCLSLDVLNTPMGAASYVGWHSEVLLSFCLMLILILFYLYKLWFYVTYLSDTGILKNIPIVMSSWAKAAPPQLPVLIEYSGPAFRNWGKGKNCVGGLADIFKCVVWVCAEKEN